MPCDSSYMEPDPRESESARVRGFLREIGLPPKSPDLDAGGNSYPSYVKQDSIYGNYQTLTEDTAALCEWCSAHDVSKQSLELQIWWRDHQRADLQREKAREADEHLAELKRQAILKLTPDERRALGL